MRAPAVLPLLAAAALAGCGQSSSATQFEGAERDVAQVVEDLQRNAERRNAEDICARVLAESLQDKVGRGSTCVEEMGKAVEDADTFQLEVEDVTITGATATARVRGTNQADGVVRTFRLAREGGDWRISSFGAPG